MIEVMMATTTEITPDLVEWLVADPEVKSDRIYDWHL